MTSSEEFEARLRAVVAWLRDKGAEGVEPTMDDLELAATSLEAAVSGLVQRDETFEIPAEIVVTLLRPFRRVGKPDEPELTQLSFHPPTPGELKKIAARERQRPEEAGILMLHLLSDDKLLEKDIEDRMLALDAQRCAEKLAPFLSLRPLSAGS